MNIFKDDEEEGKALKGTLQFVEEYAILNRNLRLPAAAEGSSVQASQLRQHLTQEHAKELQELDSFRGCLRNAWPKLIGLTVGGGLTGLFVSRKFFPPRGRLLPLVFGVSTGMLSYELGKMQFMHPCTNKFLQQQPASMFPLAAKARADLRARLPTHSLLKNCPIEQDGPLTALSASSVAAANTQPPK